jgi:hypothetical protein
LDGDFTGVEIDFWALLCPKTLALSSIEIKEVNPIAGKTARYDAKADGKDALILKAFNPVSLRFT